MDERQRIPAIKVQNARIIMTQGWRGFGPEGDRFGHRGFSLIAPDAETAQEWTDWDTMCMLCLRETKTASLDTGYR